MDDHRNSGDDENGRLRPPRALPGIIKLVIEAIKAIATLTIEVVKAVPYHHKAIISLAGIMAVFAMGVCGVFIAVGLPHYGFWCFIVGAVFLALALVAVVWAIWKRPARPLLGPRGPLHTLPEPPRDFTGREEELGKLLQQIHEGGVAISGIRGMGGIGKTALALVLAHKLAPHYPDAQLLVELRGSRKDPLPPTDAMAQVIQAFEPTARLPEDESALQKLYLSLLEGRRVLLLLDDARDARQVEPLIPPGSCALLITSRRRFQLRGGFSLDLTALPAEDARSLLLELCPRISGAADEIAGLCGYLPLALCLAGGALAVRDSLGPGKYAARLRDTRERLATLDEYRDVTSEELGVEATLELSYSVLFPDLQELWRALAIFPAGFTAAAAAAVWDVEADEAAERLEDVRGYSLVEWDAATDRWRLHDLARAFSEKRLGDAERETAARRHATHYVGVLRQADELYLEGGDRVQEGLRLFDLERANIEAGQAWSADRAEEDEAAARLCSEYPGVGAYCLNLRQHPREERTPWLEAAVKAARRIGDRGAEGNHLGNLGLAYTALGEARKAIEHHERALVIRREIGNRRGEGNDLGNLGLAYRHLGEAGKAIEHHEEAVVIRREIGDRWGEGCDLGNLGLAYADLGEEQKAIEHHEQALVIAREIGDRRMEGNALGNLGLAYADLGEVGKAIEHYERALVISREIGDRRGEGNRLGNLGNAYLRLGEAQKAIEHYQEALVIAREIGDRRMAGNDLGNLGNAYLRLGEVRKAIEHYERALVIGREIDDRRGEGNRLGNLGLAYARLGETERARECLATALAIGEALADPEITQVCQTALADLDGKGE